MALDHLRIVKAFGLAAVMTCLALNVRAQDQPGPVGLWLTQNEGGVVQIDRCDSALCGRIAGIVFDHPDDAMPLDYRGQPQCGLTIVDHAASDGEGVWSGRITDPRDGSVYGAQIRLEGQDRLLLRGYLGIPLLGQTQTWTRYTGPLREGCRLTPADVPHPAGRETGAQASSSRDAH
jgi:uncharacterized protein (DUF2147 family)